MSKDNKIVEGLRDAVAHARGEKSGCRESVVHVPNTPKRPPYAKATEGRPDVEGINSFIRDTLHHASSFARDCHSRKVNRSNYLPW